MREIDAGRHHLDPVGRNVIALADQFGELVADRDDAIAARHHAVVEPLQRILLAEALVPAGHERHARQLRGDEGAPGRSAAMRVDDVAAAAAHDARDRGDIARHDRGILARDIGIDEFAAGFLDLRLEPSAARHHDRLVAGGGEDFHEIDGARFGGAGLQRRHHDQHRERTQRPLRCRVAQLCRTAGSASVCASRAAEPEFTIIRLSGDREGCSNCSGTIASESAICPKA